MQRDRVAQSGELVVEKGGDGGHVSSRASEHHKRHPQLLASLEDEGGRVGVGGVINSIGVRKEIGCFIIDKRVVIDATKDTDPCCLALKEPRMILDEVCHHHHVREEQPVSGEARGGVRRRREACRGVRGHAEAWKGLGRHTEA